MTFYFVDTSALAKRYLSEAGSGWVRSWIAAEAGHTITLSQIASVELASVLARRVREGHLRPAIAQGLYSSFRHHVSRHYVVTPVTGDLLDQAAMLSFRHRLRSLDAIQLSSALETQSLAGAAIQFISSDANLLSVAALEGLKTDNPLDHLDRGQTHAPSN